MQEKDEAIGNHDPGDAVPEGVAVQDPAPLSEDDKAVKRKLEALPQHAKQQAPDPGGPPREGS